MKRFKLGPIVTLDFDGTKIPGRPADALDFPEITAGLKGYQTDGDGETLAVEVEASIPPYNPATNLEILRIHAVGIPEGHGMPDTPEGFVASSYPKGVADVAGMFGGTATIAFGGIPLGQTTIQLILEGDDGRPEAPAGEIPADAG